MRIRELSIAHTTMRVPKDAQKSHKSTLQYYFLAFLAGAFSAFTSVLAGVSTALATVSVVADTESVAVSLIDTSGATSAELPQATKPKENKTDKSKAKRVFFIINRLLILKIQKIEQKAPK